MKGDGLNVGVVRAELYIRVPGAQSFRPQLLLLKQRKEKKIQEKKIMLESKDLSS